MHYTENDLIIVQHKIELWGNVKVYIYNKRSEKEILIKDFGSPVILTESVDFSKKLAETIMCDYEFLEEKPVWRHNTKLL